LVVTAAYTGCRVGELIALDTDRYQPQKRIIRIERSIAHSRSPGFAWAIVSGRYWDRTSVLCRVKTSRWLDRGTP